MSSSVRAINAGFDSRPRPKKRLNTRVHLKKARTYLRRAEQMHRERMRREARQQEPYRWALCQQEVGLLGGLIAAVLVYGAVYLWFVPHALFLLMSVVGSVFSAAMAVYVWVRR